MKKEISLSAILKAMWKKAWLILIFVLVFALASYVMAYYTPKKYTSNTKVYVRNIKTGSLTTNDLNLSRYLLNAYIEVLVGNNLLQLVADELNELRPLEGYEYLKDQDYKASDIKSMIKATPGDETEIITINVTASSPSEAQCVNILLLKYFPDEIKRVIDTGEAKALYDPTVGVQTSPNIVRNTLLGALLGFIIAAAIILLIFMTDSTIHSETDLTEVFNDIPVLGVIPIIQAKDTQAYSNESKNSKA